MTNLRRIRKEAGLTQDQLSGLSGVDQGQISRMESNGCRRYSLATIRLGLALNCKPEDLIESADSGPAKPGPAVAAGKGIGHAA
jgi:transcriptional regulator with XRE-family HTH domain